jgi:light-regulated signal transduction histidine kinase (bacteriophytochrome)
VETAGVTTVKSSASAAYPAPSQNSAPGLLELVDESLPCVLYEARPSLEIISVSDNIKNLLGFKPDAVIGRPRFWNDRVAMGDWSLFQDRVSELETCGAVSFSHRVADAFGLPVWLTHSLRKGVRKGEPVIRGCLVPIGGDPRTLALDQKIVSRFIHKLGNHFQLLNLVVNSLSKSLPISRESEILQETLDRAIDLTRIFSDCNQVPSWVSEVHLLEVIKAAIEIRAAQFVAKGVGLETDLEGIPDDATIVSDPSLLETALGHVLQNALEATAAGGKVEFVGRLVFDGPHGVARCYVKDNGCGIAAEELDRVMLPFVTTKKDHDGLGLAVASRFIEMHGGALRISSNEGVGTEVEILLPLERGRDILCA